MTGPERRPEAKLLPELIVPIDGDDHRLGPLAARYQLVEYGDFESPHCAHVQPIVHELVRELGDELCFVYRHFPSSPGTPNSLRAAEAAEAAGQQGKYWLMHDRLFEHHDDLSPARIRTLAEGLPLDMRTFDRDLATGSAAQKVTADREGALTVGVEAAPTFFVNGRLNVGSYEFLPLLAALRAPP